MKGIMVVLGAVACFAGPLSSAAGAGTACDLFAMPSGSDAGTGTAIAPFRTAQELADALLPGQTGCLLPGVYRGDLRIDHGGSAGAPIRLIGDPARSATIVGRFYIPRGSDYVTVAGLRLDGINPAENLPSPTINADHATFAGDDVTNDRTAICFDVGSRTWGSAANTLITRNRIHDCGERPATNYDHGIYVATATGTRIEWNLIYNNADRGVQLYPDAQNTTVDHNVIDGNGEGIIFSGDDGFASGNSNVYDNLLTNARIRHDAESWWPDGNPVGEGNVLHNNCVWRAAASPIDTSRGGFTAYRNLIVNPQYVDASSHDYHLAPTSPCLPITADIAAAVDGTRPVVPVRRTSSPRRPPRRRR